jgi:hypothetical protein
MDFMKNYQAILKDELNFNFQDYFDIFECKSIDYIAVGVQDTIRKTSTSAMSNREWQLTYSKEKLFIQDPLRQSVFNTKKQIIILDQLQSSNSFESMVMETRKKFGICNGLVLVDRGLGFNVLITIGTGYKSFNPISFFRKNIFEINNMKLNIYNKLKNNMILN